MLHIVSTQSSLTRPHFSLVTRLSESGSATTLSSSVVLFLIQIISLGLRLERAGRPCFPAHQRNVLRLFCHIAPPQAGMLSRMEPSVASLDSRNWDTLAILMALSRSRQVLSPTESTSRGLPLYATQGSAFILSNGTTPCKVFFVTEFSPRNYTLKSYCNIAVVLKFIV